MRPLDRLPSIKLKLGVAIVAAVAVSALVSTAGLRLGVPLLLRPVIAAVIALAMVQLLARGMTSPLREMAKAAKGMAAGDYERRVTATSRDEVGELARAFNAMAAQLAEVDRMRRDLVANASHELRTPLTALQATLENAIDGVEAPDVASLRSMHRQVQRLTLLVEQLLDLSRLESGIAPLHRRPFDVTTLLHDAVDEARHQADGVTLTVHAEDGLVADGDPDRIAQVLTNLLTNAIRHSPSGGVIEVLARQDGQALTIEVADHGPGIPPEEVDRVFERFYRADSARASGAGGTGLGLSIARWIVDLHGGQLRPQANEPTGCRMVVSLPAGGSQ